MVDSSEEQPQGLARMPPTSLGLGERLRSARKARALTVAQVAEALRLEEASVVALEEGRFESMGAPVFVRGHLRRYAALVGLSTEAVLEAYRAAAPGSDAPPSIARPRVQSDVVPVGPWAWWLAAALVLVGALIAFSGGDDEPAEPASLPAPLAAPAPPAEMPPPPAPAPPPADAATAPAAAPAPGGEPPAGT